MILVTFNGVRQLTPGAVIEAKPLGGQCFHGLIPEDALEELLDRLRMGEWITVARIPKPVIDPVKLGLEVTKYQWHTRPALVWFLKPEENRRLNTSRLTKPWPIGYRAYACQASVLLINTLLQRLGQPIEW
ncbi:hypothetical protein [Caldivirga sp.]|uniref:hypothetical protein n=1 Tax=Caldivirga sp. TaxID=2080243 RepID=UPI003D0AC89F